MKPHQQRVMDEKNELSEKIKKLEGFLMTSLYDNLSTNERNLLKMQYFTMMQYQEILGMRIAVFGEGVS
jgi:hypothetical protein